MVDLNDIAVLEDPIKMDLGEWILAHPDCDTICDETGEDGEIRIYAYSLNKAGNRMLMLVRNEKYTDKRILGGLSKDAIGLFV